jgi:hypothetical protein
MDITAEQADLITDDPRCATSAAVSDFREYWNATRDLHGLLTQTQAARILNVKSGQVCTWVRRGRLTSRVVAGVRMVSAGEVLALVKERQKEIRHAGGQGVKAPSLSDLVEAAMRDMEHI